MRLSMLLLDVEVAPFESNLQRLGGRRHFFVGAAQLAKLLYLFRSWQAIAGALRDLEELPQVAAPDSRQKGNHRRQVIEGDFRDHGIDDGPITLPYGVGEPHHQLALIVCIYCVI